jgi:hypothetical protein
MTPVVDIIGTIISGMQYTAEPCIVQNPVSTPPAGPYTYFITGISNTKCLFVGEKLKFTGTSPSGVYDIQVGQIVSSTSISITSNLVLTSGHANNPGTFSSTINYMHMHPIEFEKTMAQMAQNPTYKGIRFPLIYLPQDFKESRNAEGYDAICDLVFVLMTDTRSDFSADDRYTYSFTSYLYNLYEKLIETLSDYKGIDLEYDNTDAPKHDKTDRLFWGTDRDLANKISEFIDAIEIAIKIKFLTPC